MKLRILTAVLVSLFIMSVVMLFPANAQTKENIKAQGNDKAPPGLEKIPPGLEKIVFIHYKKGHAKLDKPTKPDRPDKPSGEQDCYDFMRKGLKWKSLPVLCHVDPSLDIDVISVSRDAWDVETQENLFSIDDDTVENVDWDGDTPDGRNELSFGDYPQTGVIAVTVVWGYFTGPPDLREIFEFDILFDTDYNWGYAGETNEDEDYDIEVMDLQNIATHELGHGLGLGDIYTDGCSDVTMFGFSTEGETKKRTLDDPDITGIQELYGAP